MEYYKLIDGGLIDASSARKNWAVSILERFEDGTPLNVWAFMDCQVYTGKMPIPFRVSQKGKRVDFNETAFGAIVVSKRLADVLSALVGDGIQRIPAGVPGSENWEVINILERVNCIDYSQSIIQFFPANFEQPAKAGKPRGVLKLQIRKEAAMGHHFFRPADWEVAIIVSEAVRQLVSENGFTNMEFRKVT